MKEDQESFVLEIKPALESERFLVWLIAILAGLGAIGEAVQALLEGRLDRVFLWWTIAVLMVAGTTTMETIKARRQP